MCFRNVHALQERMHEGSKRSGKAMHAVAETVLVCCRVEVKSKWRLTRQYGNDASVAM